mmetsp:Transcript_19827/g.46099  ORF Transcript_19827/g.46099 Transcript_19827/m.46099 type:complete len:393 (-) Transcript_19827:108-1286(-)
MRQWRLFRAASSSSSAFEWTPAGGGTRSSAMSPRWAFELIHLQRHFASKAGDKAKDAKDKGKASSKANTAWSADDVEPPQRQRQLSGPILADFLSVTDIAAAKAHMPLSCAAVERSGPAKGGRDLEDESASDPPEETLHASSGVGSEGNRRFASVALQRAEAVSMGRQRQKRMPVEPGRLRQGMALPGIFKEFGRSAEVPSSDSEAEVVDVSSAAPPQPEEEVPVSAKAAVAFASQSTARRRRSPASQPQGFHSLPHEEQAKICRAVYTAFRTVCGDTKLLSWEIGTAKKLRQSGALADLVYHLALIELHMQHGTHRKKLWQQVDWTLDVTSAALDQERHAIAEAWRFRRRAVPVAEIHQMFLDYEITWPNIVKLLPPWPAPSEEVTSGGGS